MPTWELECSGCKSIIVVTNEVVSDVDHSEFICPECGRPNLTLLNYEKCEVMTLRRLLEAVQNLEDRINAIEDIDNELDA